MAGEFFFVQIRLRTNQEWLENSVATRSGEWRWLANYREFSGDSEWRVVVAGELSGIQWRLGVASGGDWRIIIYFWFYSRIDSL